MMTLNEYQQLAARTANGDLGDKWEMANAALGLAGEAGEVVDLFKKHLTHGHELPVDKMRLELGDALWYLAKCARVCGLTLEEIGEANIEKLKKRYPDGFDPKRSQSREE